MTVFVFLFILLTSAAAELISIGEIENLLSKVTRGNATDQETETLRHVIDIFYSYHEAGRSFETASPFRLSVECIACRSAGRVLIQNIRDGQSDEDAIDTVVHLCTSMNIMTSNVCRGAVELNIPILAHIIRTVPEATAEAFCGLVFQRAEDPNTCPFNDPRFEWQVTLPEKNVVTQTRVYNQNPLKVAIFTDVHLDPLYEPFGVADCDEPTCCRKGQNPRIYSNVRQARTNSQLENAIVEDNGEIKLNLTTVPKIDEQNGKSLPLTRANTAPPAGFWGDYRNCDTPIWAFDDAVETVQQNHKDIDIVYYMGDTIDHGVWETSYELINDMNKYLINKTRRTFGDHILVVPVIGNHESQPTNQFAPARVVGEKLNTTWLYQALADKWSFYLTEEAKITLRERGEYTLLVRPGLRVITLNNNVAYKYNWWVVYDPLDAKKHLDWLIEELHKAELAGEKVHILVHLPPGVHDLTYTWTREYNRIVNRFSDTIAAEFNGHTHADEFKVFYSPEGAPTNVAWGAGALTAYTFYNLNYKIVTFDANNYGPTEMVTYGYNLEEANRSPNRSPHWFMLYDMRNSFGLLDLSPHSMHDLVYSMVTTNRRMLTLYTAFYSKISEERFYKCDTQCQLSIACRAVVTVLWERQRCDELRQLYNS